MLPDTCEIEEGKQGQFELFRNGKSFMKAGHGKFFGIEEVRTQLLFSDKVIYTD